MNNNKKPLVSVIIPTYNRASIIEEAVSSALAQTWKNTEIIVVDDGSTDSTKERLQPYLDSIHYIYRPNGGLAAARNTGTETAHGDFIAWLDSDDVWSPEKLEMQVNFMLRHIDVVASSTDFSEWRNGKIKQLSHITGYYRAARGRRNGARGFYGKAEWIDMKGKTTNSTGIWTGKGDIYKDLVWGNFVHPPTTMIRRTAIDAAGLQDETLPNMSDYEYFLRLSRLGPFGYLDKPLLWYRYSQDQLSGPKYSLSIWLSLIEIMHRIVQDDPGVIEKRDKKFRHRHGLMYLRLAEIQAEAGDFNFLGSMYKGLQRRPCLKPIVFIFAKAMLPKNMLTWGRGLKK